MSDAREIIAEVIQDFRDAGQPINDVVLSVSDDIISTLTAAGYRILGPDEVDALDRLRARADAWPLNSDSARVSVRLGDLRALGRKA